MPSNAPERLLDELESVLRLLPERAYHAPPADGGPAVADHVTRCLDLLESLVAAGASRAAIYGVPSDEAAAGPAAALRRVAHLRALSANRRDRAADAIVPVELGGSLPGLDDHAWSTLAIERAFVVTHIVGRQTRIARILADLGVPVPAGFGSTPLPPLRARWSVPPAVAAA